MAAVIPQFSGRQALLDLEGEAFVRQAYLYALDRPVDSSGLESYLGHLALGVTREAILAELEASQEGQRVALRRGRSRPPAGSSFGRGAPSVLPPAAVVGGAFADRAGARVGSASELLLVPEDAQFLRAAYLHLLRREPDSSGLENYLRQLASGCTRDQVLVELVSSPEGRLVDAKLPGLEELLRRYARALELPEVRHVHDLLSLAPEVFVRAAYQAVLARDVDPEGLALYTDLLLQGWSRSYVLNELVQSAEGRASRPVLRGLKPLVKRYRKAQSRSLRGWYHRAVKGAESDLPQDRLLRAALLSGRR